MPNLLIVEDEPLVRRSLVRLLGEVFDCVAVTNGIEALEALSQREFDLVITDVNMPDLEGDALILQVRRDNPRQKFFLCTANYDRVHSLKGLGVPIFTKPFDPPGLLKAVCGATGVPLPDALVGDQTLS